MFFSFIGNVFDKTSFFVIKKLKLVKVSICSFNSNF